MLKTIYLITIDALMFNGKPKEGAVSFLKALEMNRLPYVILTEQSGRTREKLCEDMKEIGFRYIRPGYIYFSAMAAVDYIVSTSESEIRSAYMIGGSGMKEVLEKGGFAMKQYQADYLFVGMNRNLSYLDYSEALCILEEGAQLISTDERRTQLVDSQNMIGNGAIVKMLEYASGTKSLSFGRGSELFIKQSLRYIHTDSEHAVFVGNDFQRDILPAQRLGMTTVYVTEGRSIMNCGMNEQWHPDYIVNDLNGLTK